MKKTTALFITLFLISGCVTMVNRFPPGSNVQVTEWQVFHGSAGEKTLRGTVANYSHYLVYDLELLTYVYDSGTLRKELRTPLPNLFPETQTRFEIMLPAGLEDPHPEFQYQFQYTREEEFEEYRYQRRFGIGPLQMYPSAGAWWYRSSSEEEFDSRRHQNP